MGASRHNLPGPPAQRSTPKPVWLWRSGTDATPADAECLWQAYLRRCDIEHTFRLVKHILGWTSPPGRLTPAQAGTTAHCLRALLTEVTRGHGRRARQSGQPWARGLTPARVRVEQQTQNC